MPDNISWKSCEVNGRGADGWNRLPLQSTVFKAGHHGSRSSSSRAFLEEVQPYIVIISAGKENRYDHPHPEVLQRAEEIGATALRTDEMGNIEIISDGQQVWWQADAN